MLSDVLLSIIMLNVILLSVDMQRYSVYYHLWRYTDCRYAE
jgi:hypothetical protein